MNTLDNRALRTLITRDGELRLFFVDESVAEPGPHEVVVAIEAAPINPSDLGLLVGPADLTTASVASTGDGQVLTATIPSSLLPYVAARLDEALPVGNEGAGRVVRAGASPEARALLGRMVAVLGGATYARFCRAPASACLALAEDTSAAEGAAAFVNPLTALGMVETMRAENHAALIHTAAASNLGLMLNRICRAEGVGLVNIVRRPSQDAILREAGAAHVCDRSAPDFRSRLVESVRETGATLAFDAIGGGSLADEILAAMETVASAALARYSRYGSSAPKHVYIYGMLDTGPTALSRSYGLSWGVGGWLLTNFLNRAGPEVAARLRQRVASELRTMFASHYARTIPLSSLLDPATLLQASRKETGGKFLVDTIGDPSNP